MLREAVTSYEAHITDAQHRVEYGVAARNEVLAVQVERDRAELARLQAENAAAISEADLLRLDRPAARDAARAHGGGESDRSADGRIGRI